MYCSNLFFFFNCIVVIIFFFSLIELTVSIVHIDMELDINEDFGWAEVSKGPYQPNPGRDF